MTASRRSSRSLGEGQVSAAFVDGTATRVTEFDSGWDFCKLPHGSSFIPADAGAQFWRPAAVPGTVAGALRALGELDEESGSDFDEHEFVFRRRFRHDGAASGSTLIFDGLATLTDVWLNGTRILSARSMFRRNFADVDSVLGAENELLLHFRALSPELARRRPRGRWTTRLVKHRNLRYIRTSLLGRMPGWAPLNPPVGPWRGIRLIESGKVDLSHLSITPTLDGSDGVVSIAMRGRVLTGEAPVALEVRVGGSRAAIQRIDSNVEGFEVGVELRVPGVTPWWSHDLGTPHRYPLTLLLHLGSGNLEIGTVRIGFRRIERRGDDADGFALRVNGRDIFCRGACWTPADVVGFADDPVEIRRVVGLVRDAGMNMLRLSGTMVYESDAFYDACDELGILVWQDFMFASMDYPEEDAEFAADVRIEAEQVLARIQHHPCLAVLCGNSEVEQQAAMNGLAPDSGMTRLFRHTLKEAGQRWCPGIPFISSSPTGGALPFHVDAGIAHYFGVGAYLRPLADARASRVRFASECLAFSNVPEDASLEELFGDEIRATHSPRYKSGVPRDSGAGWDFSDVTDHYIEQLFRCDVRGLRYSATERYLAFARVTPGELMERTFGVWRANDSTCRGGLVWFLRDLRAGSGWGVLDSAGRPKAPYWFLKRACAPRAIWFTDEGLNGLRLHVQNDPLEPLAARVRVRLIGGNGVAIGSAETDILLEGGGGRAFSVDALLGGFADTTYAYRFGPCAYSIAVAELVLDDASIAATAHYLPMGLAHSLQNDIALSAVARPRGDGSHDLRIESRSLALFVRIAADGYFPADNYFHVAPGGARNVVLSPLGAARPLRGQVTALNSQAQVCVELGDCGR